MAPELFEGGTASVPSDIYSLGVLLFYLTTGRYPVEGKSLVDVRAAHQAGRRVLLSDMRSDLPSHFVDAIERALSRLPENRCQSAGAMLRSLSTGTLTHPRLAYYKSAAFGVITVVVLGGGLWLRPARLVTVRIPIDSPPPPRR